MRTYARLAALLSATVVANAANAAYADWPTWQGPGQAGWAQETVSEVVQHAEDAGSAALFVVYQGKVLLSLGEIEKKLSAHSIRKSLLSGLFGVHVGTGAIDLEATLADLDIDDVSRLSAGEKQARVVDLLGGRSGVYHPAAYETAGKKRERPARGSHRPGTHFWSNNWDFNVLLTVFEQQTGRRFFDEFYRAIARPIGMQDFEASDGEYLLEPAISKHPAYPLRISARDLARYGQLVLNGGNWNGRSIVPESWIERSTRAKTTFGEGGGYTGDFRAGAGFGFMWWVYPRGSQPAGRPVLDTLNLVAAQGSGGHLMLVIRELDLVFVHRAATDDGRRVDWDTPWSLAEALIAGHASYE